MFKLFFVRYGKALVCAGVMQVCIVLVSLWIGVVGPALRSEVEFKAPVGIALPEQRLEKRAAQMEFNRAAGGASSSRPILSEVLMPGSVALPEGMDAIDSFGDSLHMSQMTTLLGQSGLLGGMQGGLGGTSDIQFYGIRDQATRIVIAFDVSASVVRKVESSGGGMLQMRAETQRLIEGLNANTLFGLIQFSRRYDTFRDYMVPATVSNKRAANEWLLRSFRTDGRSGSGWRQDHPDGIEAVLSQAMRLDPAPDVVVILSDGSFQRSRGRGGEDVPWAEVFSLVERLSRGRPTPRIHFVAFGMEERDRGQVRRLVQQYRGQLREF